MSHEAPDPVGPLDPTGVTEPAGHTEHNEQNEPPGLTGLTGLTEPAGTADPGSQPEGPRVPVTPQAAVAVFGDRLPLAEHFVAILADTGITHGLIGPREAPRLWDRHVLNCAVVHEAIPPTGEIQRVIDVGSGAGLPGLALAIARPDLELHLVEPLARRTAWLTDTVEQLALTNVAVHTARAEALWDDLDAPWVTARAVSKIVQLAEWTLPLLRPHGSLLALKGSRAQDELDESGAALSRLGVVAADVRAYGAGLLADPTLVLRATIGEAVDRRRFRSRRPSSAGSARRRADRPRGSRRSGTAAGGRRRHQP